MCESNSMFAELSDAVDPCAMQMIMWDVNQA